MGVRGARQGPIPHQTRRSHWVGLSSMSCFLGGISSAFSCWGFKWRQWLAPDGVVTADLAHQPLALQDHGLAGLLQAMERGDVLSCRVIIVVLMALVQPFVLAWPICFSMAG